jgi:hypothetical protein
MSETRDDGALYFDLPNKETDILGDQWVARLKKEHSVSQEQRAAEARAGGRALTRNIVNFRQRAGGAFEAEALRTGDRKTVNAIWQTSIDPYGGHGRGGWRRIARSASGQGSYPDTVYGNPERTLVSLAQAEAMFSWPIYRAALIQSTDNCQSYGHREP